MYMQSMPLSYLGLLLVILDAEEPVSTQELARKAPKALRFGSRLWCLRAMQAMERKGWCRAEPAANNSFRWGITAQGKLVAEEKMEALSGLYFAEA